MAHDAAHHTTLLLYSDGVTEVFTEPGILWGSEGLIAFMQTHDLRDPGCLDELHRAVTAIAGHEVLNDDFSAMLVRFP